MNKNNFKNIYFSIILVYVYDYLIVVLNIIIIYDVFLWFLIKSWRYEGLYILNLIFLYYFSSL